MDYIQAVKTLESYKNQIDDLEYDNAQIWVKKVSDTLKTYLGKDSQLYREMVKFYFSESLPTESEIQGGDFFGVKHYLHFNKKEEKKRAKNILEAAIEIIHNLHVAPVSGSSWEKEIATLETVDILHSIAEDVSSPTPENIVGELAFHILQLNAVIQSWEKLIDEEIRKDKPELADKIRKMIDEETSAIYLRFYEGHNDVSEHLNHALQKYLKGRIEE